MSKLFIGDLLESVTKPDLEKEFQVFGELESVWVAHKPPWFAFVVYKHKMCAAKAVRALDGKNVLGSKIRVEFAKNGPRWCGRKGMALSPPPQFRHRSRSLSPQRRRLPPGHGVKERRSHFNGYYRSRTPPMAVGYRGRSRSPIRPCSSKPKERHKTSPSTHPVAMMADLSLSNSSKSNLSSSPTDSRATLSAVSIATTECSENGDTEDAIGGVPSNNTLSHNSQIINSRESDSEEYDTDLEDGEEDSSNEKKRMTITLVIELINCIRQKRYQLAQKLCKMILIYEPDNSDALKFQPLIEHRLLQGESFGDDTDDSDRDSDDDDGSSSDESSKPKERHKTSPSTHPVARICIMGDLSRSNSSKSNLSSSPTDSIATLSAVSITATECSENGDTEGAVGGVPSNNTLSQNSQIINSREREFGSEDQDNGTIPPTIPTLSTAELWSKYKATHPNEFKTPQQCPPTADSGRYGADGLRNSLFPDSSSISPDQSQQTYKVRSKADSKPPKSAVKECAASTMKETNKNTCPKNAAQQESVERVPANLSRSIPVQPSTTSTAKKMLPNKVSMPQIKTTSYSNDGRSGLGAADKDTSHHSAPATMTESFPTTTGKDSKKSTKQKGRKYKDELRQLRSQHFIELLSSIQCNPCKRIYGMYIFMNKVYVTCLMIKHPDDVADTDNDYTSSEDVRKVEMINFLKERNWENYNLPDGKWAKAGYKFEVLYSKFLDIFKPGHLKALLMFVNFVTYSDYRKTMLF